MKQSTDRFSFLAAALVACGGVISACSSAATNINSNGNKVAAAQSQPAAGGDQTDHAENVKTEKQTDVLAAFKKGDDYKTTVRPKIVKDGWQPARSEDGDDNCESGMAICEEYPELNAGPAAGLGNIVFRWKKGERVLLVYTVDDSPIYQSHEFERPAEKTRSNAAGKYIYSSKHEYGTDRFIYELKNNNVAAYTSEMEGDSGENKIGTWSWDEANKTVTITFPPQKRNEAEGIDEDVPEQIFVFKMDGDNLKMTEEPMRGAGYVGFTGAVFKKQRKGL